MQRASGFFCRFQTSQVSFEGQSSELLHNKPCLPNGSTLPLTRSASRGSVESLPTPESRRPHGEARHASHTEEASGRHLPFPKWGRWSSERDGHLSRSFGSKMMEAGLAFPTAGQQQGGWVAFVEGDEGRIVPTSIKMIDPRELGHWRQGHGPPFSPPPLPRGK